ncbi:MAG: RNA methyltransferase, TrmA family [Candidatus Peregrinibacteria bacterium GW2011_GWC2_39_14]|nr:MAG: RNA methyltransferase, TrmA family [Candidatus Peregrinibacteria bacterium GW2011_GWA2_38_36]KKR06607.1 MAG: RNA methyltransferase, TrmA family [Candidatus Peregrinibacteria bacterium GW2011_GWC2_39_14]
MFKRGDKTILKIENLAFGGQGIGRVAVDDDKAEIKGKKLAVFVENVIPGDEVEVSFFHIKKNFAEANVVRMIKPSELRIAPRCRHFGTCGGCVWQNLNYEKQLEYKENQVRESLERIGKFENPPVKKIIGCKSPWEYRNKMEFSFDGSGANLQLGLHLARMHHDVVDIQECFLVSGICVEITKFVRDFLKKSGGNGGNGGNGSNAETALDLRNFIIREAKTTGEIMANLVTGTEFENVLVEKMGAEINEKFPSKITSFYHTKISDKRGERKSIKEELVFGAPVIREELLIHNEKIKFDITPSAFFQPNTFQAQVLYETVFSLADAKKSDSIFDLFCGTGTIGICFAKFSSHIFGVEINASAIEIAKKNAELNNLKNIEFLCGDAERTLKNLPQNPDIIIVDPPRACLGEKLSLKLAGFKARKIIFVSCNPTTFARDARILVDNGYALREVQPVDMFPHTYHIETVAVFEKN